MILCPRENKQDTKSGIRPRDEPYLIINIILAGVILLVMVYSGIFSPESDDHPVPCIHEKITGEACASCGLSHSFSFIVRGRFKEASEWNENGMRVFIFFAAQFLMRISFSGFYFRYPGLRRQLILMDITGSVLIFLIAFMPFIVSIFKWL